MIKKKRTYSADELERAARKMESQGYDGPAEIARRGYPSLAALAFKREREKRERSC